MAYDVTLIPGDGIGPEVSSCTQRILEASGVKISWETAEAGAAVADATGTPVPDSVLTSVRKNNIALKGPIGTPIGKGFRSVNVTLRKALRLYACLRPVKSLPGIATRYDDIDLIIIIANGLLPAAVHNVTSFLLTDTDAA